MNSSRSMQDGAMHAVLVTMARSNMMCVRRPLAPARREDNWHKKKPKSHNRYNVIALNSSLMCTAKHELSVIKLFAT